MSVAVCACVSGRRGLRADARASACHALIMYHNRLKGDVLDDFNGEANRWALSSDRKQREVLR